MNKDITPGRDSFVFYRSFYASIQNVPEDAQLMLYKAVVEYGLNQEPPTFSGSQYGPFLTAIWEGMRPQLDANFQRFLNGRNGGCPKGIEKPSMRGNQNARKHNQNKTESKPNVNVNDNVNVNGNVNVDALPYNSDEFVNTWNELISQPKWRSKTATAISKCLSQLSRFPEEYAIELMNTAIANNYQGVVFSSTDKDFKRWKQTHNQPERTKGKVISNISDLYD